MVASVAGTSGPEERWVGDETRQWMGKDHNGLVDHGEEFDFSLPAIGHHC